MTVSRPRPSDPPDPLDHGTLRLTNQGTGSRTVVVVVDPPDGPSSVETVGLVPDGTVTVPLPTTGGGVTVGCHTDDGRSGVFTYVPGESDPVVLSLEGRSILLDQGRNRR